MEEGTGATSLVKSLDAAGVRHTFSIPGGAILPAYDPLMDSSMRHTLVHHEQGAGHAAQGYAAPTRRAGVCMATSGPGATNLVTPLADAFMDSVPITGQVDGALLGAGAFREAAVCGTTRPIAKHSYTVGDPHGIPRVIAEAFHIASTGRPGPVLVGVTKSALQARTKFDWPTVISIAGYSVPEGPHPKPIEVAAELIFESRRPILYVGGVIRSGASPALANLVATIGIPVGTTLMARGAFPASTPLDPGMPGMHGTVAAVAGRQKSDLIVALGARFDNRVTGDLRSFAPDAKVESSRPAPRRASRSRSPSSTTSRSAWSDSFNRCSTVASAASTCPNSKVLPSQTSRDWPKRSVQLESLAIPPTRSAQSLSRPCESTTFPSSSTAGCEPKRWFGLSSPMARTTTRSSTREESRRPSRPTTSDQATHVTPQLSRCRPVK